jgi:hypothetical protein
MGFQVLILNCSTFMSLAGSSRFKCITASFVFYP